MISDQVFLDPHAVDFSGFAGRDASLGSIYRYRDYPVAWYRSDLLTHSWRVLYLLQAVLPRALWDSPQTDTLRLQAMCLVHDDAEIITGDFPTVRFGQMSQAEIDAVERSEEDAIEALHLRFPREVLGYVYAPMLSEVFRKDTRDAQIVKYMDHVDGVCEALHEIFAGNACFVTSPDTEHGLVPIPPDYHLPRLRNPEKHYPLITDLFDGEMPFSHELARIDFESAAAAGRPHTRENILDPSGYPLYDWWKATLWQTGDERVRARLVERSPKVTL